MPAAAARNDHRALRLLDRPTAATKDCPWDRAMSPAFIVHPSNQTEALVEALADVVRTPASADPLASEAIVVQSRGMARWLAMALAERLDVWADMAFPFPRGVVEWALDAVVGRAPAARAFSSEQLIWAVAAELPRHLDHPAFDPVARYLADDGRHLKRLQLARRIAQVFDDYVVYRPDLVRSWESGAAGDVGAADAWQPILWRALGARPDGATGARPGAAHIAARIEAFLAQAGDAAGTRAHLEASRFPRRLCLFGLSALPGLFLDVFAALGRCIEVHVFVQAPSRRLWVAIQSRRPALADLMAAGAGSEAVAGALELPDPHLLLGSCGRAARDFEVMLAVATGRTGASPPPTPPATEAWVEAAPGTMLRTLQADILAGRPRGPGRPGAPPLPLAASDASVAIHACHGPMREVEVLRDQLLALFDTDGTLEPRDIVVMAPDIERYAPYVDAVFGAADGAVAIPYRVADRRPEASYDVVAALARLVDALRGRLTAPEVLDVLSIASVRRRLGIPAEGLDTVRDWVTGARVRWGADAAHRAEVGQPADGANTWRFGLDRLLLGYAMPGDGHGLFAGALPYAEVDGGDAELLGRLAEGCEALFAFRDRVRDPQPVAAWRDTLGAILERFVWRSWQSAWQHELVRGALETLARHAADGGFAAGVVDWEIVRRHLLEALHEDAPPRGFLSGGVTFCSLLPMRSIPFRVVCLLGLGDGELPRAEHRAGFDLIARAPRAGDRTPRDDDRHLFLEALLAARERLIITFVGQSVQDGRRLPPSTLVSELLDVLGDAFDVPHPAPPDSSLPAAVREPPVAVPPAPPGPPLAVPPAAPDTVAIADAVHQARDRAADIRRRLIVWHPIQPFSPRYFDGRNHDPAPGDGFFSFAARYVASARTLAAARVPRRPFFEGPLAPPAQGGGAVREVTLESLVRFFQHPTRALLQIRLGLYLGGPAEVPPDREPLAPGPIDRWQVGQRLLDQALARLDPAALRGAHRAEGWLPPGTPGDCLFDDLASDVAALAGAAAPWLAGDRLAPVELDLMAGDTRVTGVLRDLWARAQVAAQYARAGGAAELALWLRHLALGALAARAPGARLPERSVLVGRPADSKARGVATVCFEPVAGAEAVLADLVDFYWIGQSAPLPLFKAASRAYADAWHRDGDAAAALARARRAFAGNRVIDGDAADPYVAQTYGDADPLDEAPASAAVAPSFEAVARTVYDPLLAHRRVLAEGDQAPAGGAA